MVQVRRFVLASSLARLLQREGGPGDRLVEAYFPARSDRTQLVRVERGRASLILRSSAPDGQVSEEAVEVPLSHAEALVEVAAGTVAFDRTAVALSRSAEAVLDRFIMPQGLDLLRVTIAGDPRTFAPPLWLGPEVTHDPAFDARELAISGLPAVGEVEVTSAALEALLDTLGTPGAYRPHAQPQRGVRQPDIPAVAPRSSGAALASPGSAVRSNEGLSGGDEEPPRYSRKPLPSAAKEMKAAAGGEGLTSQPQEAHSEGGEVDRHGSAANLPDVADGPGLEGERPAARRRPMLRTNVKELDEGIARLACSLAPRRPRSE